MHRSAASATPAFGEAEHLREGLANAALQPAIQLRGQGVETGRGVVHQRLGQEMMVRPVGGVYLVPFPQAKRRPDRHRFLADA